MIKGTTVPGNLRTFQKSSDAFGAAAGTVLVRAAWARDSLVERRGNLTVQLSGPSGTIPAKSDPNPSQHGPGQGHAKGHLDPDRQAEMIS